MSVGHCTQREPSLLRQSLFGCSIFVPKLSPPTRFISCSKPWMLKPQPHNVVVPKTGAIVKKQKKERKITGHGCRLSHFGCTQDDAAEASCSRRDFYPVTDLCTVNILACCNIPAITWLRILISHEFTTDAISTF